MRFLLILGLLLVNKVSSETVSSSKLESHIVMQNLRSNLVQLNNIANSNGGNRAFGFPGYKASVEFVLSRIRGLSTVTAYTQEFTAWFTQTFHISLSVNGVSIPILDFTGTPSTPNRKVLTTGLIFVPGISKNGTACTAADYKGVDAAGKVVLIKRGACAFALKTTLAKTKGAVGVIIYNTADGELPGGSVGSGDLVPVGMISLTDGLGLVKRLQAGETLSVDFMVDAIGEYRQTWNVIAETKGGDPKNVIVLGGNLDSVQDGAGINDNGSGVSALLELIVAVAQYSTTQKIRFIWWGAEENGQLGSYHYTKALSATEIKNIAMYLNIGMIGSINAFYGVFDGDGSTYGFHPAAGSGDIEQRFVNYIQSNGKVVHSVAFANGTDYVGFLDIGVPVGGLFAGAVPQDKCYHLKCDDINNINWDVLTFNAKAVANVLGWYSLSLESIPNRPKRKGTIRGWRIRGTR